MIYEEVEQKTLNKQMLKRKSIDIINADDKLQIKFTNV